MLKHVKTTVKAKENIFIHSYLLYSFVYTNIADNTSLSVIYIFLKQLNVTK